MRGWVTGWEVGVGGQLCPHHTAGSPSPFIMRGGSLFFTSGPLAPTSLPGLPLPFPLLPGLASVRGGEGGAGWPGPGLTSQQLF